MRLYVSSIDLSIGDPSLAVRRYFLSQMSNEASWKVILLTSLGCILTTVFMGIRCAPLELSRETTTDGRRRPIGQVAHLNEPRVSELGTTTYCVWVGRVRPLAG